MQSTRKRFRPLITPLRVLGGVVALALAGVAIAVGTTAASATVPSPINAATTTPTVAAVSPPTMAPATARRSHHIIAIDQSLSVQRVIGPMKIVVRDYIRRYVTQGDRVTVFAFSYDATGSVREVLTFDYGPDGERLVERLLDDIKIQSAPGRTTMTLFRPLRDALDQFLRTKVVDSPTYFIVSDGKSDGATARRRGQVDYEDIAFESLGRATYAVPNARGWWVAVGGGQGVDYSALFSPTSTGPAAPLTPSVRSSPKRVPSPALAECLLEPGVSLAGTEPVVLQPILWPGDRIRTVDLRLGIRGECVTRRRDLRVFLEGEEGRDIELPPIQLILGATEQVASVPLELPVDGRPKEVRRLRVVLTLAEGFSRTVGEVPVLIERPSWLSAYGYRAGFGGGAATLGLLGLVAGTVRAKRRRDNKPEYVRIPGSNAVTLRRRLAVDVGGDRCALRVPGAEDDDCIARLEWSSGVRGVFSLQPEDDWTLKVNGVEGVEEVAAGSSVEAAHTSGRRLVFTLATATSRDIGKHTSATLVSPGTDDLFSSSATGSASGAGTFDF